MAIQKKTAIKYAKELGDYLTKRTHAFCLKSCPYEKIPECPSADTCFECENYSLMVLSAEIDNKRFDI